MKTVLMVCGVVLALVGVVRADFVTDFEGLTVGSIADQDAWTKYDGIANVTATGGVAGTQGLNIQGQAYHSAGATWSPDPVNGQTVYFRFDVQYSGMNYVQLWSAPEVAGWEFGFDTWAGNMYTHGGSGGPVHQGTGGLPTVGDWVTAWAVLDYKADTAQLGWCSLTETPFVDGVRIPSYEMGKSFGTIDVLGSSLTSNYDNLSITTIPEPGTLGLLVGGFVGLLAYAWRKHR